ncbi:hypothetical protein PM082_016768 [Marasmius tenuissimus]|nr:hypothetical protein PM082_016768 [Marasmius tenuissimus]
MVPTYNLRVVSVVDIILRTRTASTLARYLAAYKLLPVIKALYRRRSMQTYRDRELLARLRGSSRQYIRLSNSQNTHASKNWRRLLRLFLRRRAAHLNS